MNRRGMTLVETIVVIAIITVLMAIALPAIQRIRAAMDAVACQSKLRQIGIGLHHHETDYGYLPSGVYSGTVNEPWPRMTFLTRILPYIEQDQVWREGLRAYELDRVPFNNPPHTPFATVMPLYSCPLDPRLKRAHPTHNNRTAALTSYVGCIGTNTHLKDGIFYLNSRTTTATIGDGSSNTIAVGERPPSADYWYGWWYASTGQLGGGSPDVLCGAREVNLGGPFTYFLPPGPYHFGPGRFSNMADCFHFWSPHPGGAHFLFGDGSARFLRYSADAILPALATRGGGEAVELPD
jgi:prepilin-type N-terminal cleavage/methylation domain-containing protein/prepilin-type processing-associated H-X9-DG protein